jgi:inosine-uridine nucleoside N-ribohydrolase
VRRLHLDTDIGGDIDDLCALAMVLNWPDVELVGITTVAEDRGKRAGYARYALGLAGRQDVPVAAGADVSLHCYRSKMGFPDELMYWPEPISASPTPLDEALDLLEHSIEQDATVAAIGPFTNLALLEKRSPGILRTAHLYLMGGYVFPPGEGYPPWGRDMDWNVQVDVASALFVLQQSNPALVPISVTVQTALRRAYLPALRKSTPVGDLIARQSEAFARDECFEARYGQTCKGLPEDIINFLHDPLACGVALGWGDGVEFEEVPLKTDIRDGYLHQCVDDTGRPTIVATRVDGDRFSEFWLTTVVSARQDKHSAG